MDHLVIGEKSSHYDFDATVKSRKISAPKKKSIKATIPFSNETYDFSNIDGEIYWEERTLSYTLEIIACSAEALEEKKTLFCGWVMNVANEELHDPFIKDYHFIATFDSIDIDTSEIEKATITVDFTAYPYMISNRPIEHEELIDAEEKNVVVENRSAHRVIPTITADAPFTLKFGDTTFTANAGTYKSEKIMLAVGENTLTFITDEEVIVTISFHEEVF